MSEDGAIGPLATTDENAITRVFSSDPLTLNDADYTLLVTELRRRRSAYLAKEAADKLKPKKDRPLPPTVTASKAFINDKPPEETTLADLLKEE